MTADYWDQFIATVSFLEPCEVEGTLTRQEEPLRGSDGPIPRFLLRLSNGRTVRVQAPQARLLEELTRTRPRVGDHVRIVYRGEAKRSAPGFSPTKEFTVEVQRANPPGGRPDAKASAATSDAKTPENGPRAGTK